MYLPLSTAKEIELDFDNEILYSICTLVTIKEEYQEMMSSFVEAGFDTSFCEFLYIDNTTHNKSEAYQGLNYFLQKAKGKYIILCHQDILICHDKIDRLEQCIADLDQLDPSWAIMANAGASGIKDIVYRLIEPNNVVKRRGHPIQKVTSVDENFILVKKSANLSSIQKVTSVDENFILVKKSANLSLSNNLKGFHLYGTDLCIIANILGFNAYVVHFYLLHKSKGNVDTSFYILKNELQLKYQRALAGKYIQTTCTNFYLSSSNTLNALLNMKFTMFFVRNYISIKQKVNKTGNEIPKSEW